MGNDKLTFGEFIIQKRKEKDLSARQLAIKLDVSPVLMCDIEKGRRMATNDFLENLKAALYFTQEESELMYDLAAAARNTVSADLPQYIMENELVRTALRAAKKYHVSDEKWERFINEIIRKE